MWDGTVDQSHIVLSKGDVKRKEMKVHSYCEEQFHQDIHHLDCQSRLQKYFHRLYELEDLLDNDGYVLGVAFAGNCRMVVMGMSL